MNASPIGWVSKTKIEIKDLSNDVRQVFTFPEQKNRQIEEEDE